VDETDRRPPARLRDRACTQEGEPGEVPRGRAGWSRWGASRALTAADRTRSS